MCRLFLVLAFITLPAGLGGKIACPNEANPREEATMLAAKGAFPQAAACFEAALAKDNGNMSLQERVQTRAQLALAQAEGRKFKSALRSLRKAEETLEEGGESDNHYARAFLLLTEAQIRVAQGRLGKARDILKQAVETDRDNIEARVLYAQILEGVNHPEEALEEYTYLFRVANYNPAFATSAALLMVQLGDLSRAEETALTSIRHPQQVNPSMAYVVLAFVYWKRGDFQKALESTQMALSTDEANIMVRMAYSRATYYCILHPVLWLAQRSMYLPPTV
jgi:tetratricopeptide (TPR) repeat protein